MLGPVLCGLLSQAPLLPKLRGHFAEFLNNASSVGLRIFSLPTCVGLRYGFILYNSSFSRHSLCMLPYCNFGPRRATALCTGFSWCTAPALVRVFPFPAHASRMRPCSSDKIKYRNFNLLSIALGPDFPRADQLYSGNLGYSAGRILTFLSLLIPAFSLRCSPLLLSVQLLRASNAPLPLFRVLSFGVVFEPR